MQLSEHKTRVSVSRRTATAENDVIPGMSFFFLSPLSLFPFLFISVGVWAFCQSKGKMATL